MTTTAKKSASRHSVSPSASASRSPAEAYRHFLSDVEGLPDAELQRCRIDLPLALHNVQLGVDSVRPHEARIRKELPALEVDALWSLPDLAAGLIYAADRIAGPASKTEIAEKLGRLRRLREAMLLCAEGLALLGLVPTERVTAIRAGKGLIDIARDGIALEALYREHAVQLHNKHPFSEGELREAADLGNFLVRAIKPAGGRPRPEVESPAVLIRDRFYTLLVRRHIELRKAGFYLFGDEVESRVPALGSRLLGTRRPGAAPPAPGSELAPVA